MADEIMDNAELENDDLVILADEDGEGIEVEVLDVIEYEGAEYAVMLPYVEDEAQGAELLILKVETLDEVDEDGIPYEQYVSVDSPELLDTLYGIFQETHADEFDFETVE